MYIQITKKTLQMPLTSIDIKIIPTSNDVFASTKSDKCTMNRKILLQLFLDSR